MQRNLTRALGTFALAAGLSTFSTSCNKDLNQQPDYTTTADVLYRDPVQIQQVLARLYATFALSGQNGPAGSPDISGIDEGFSQYLRQYWQLQEVTTDEAIIGWNDGNLVNLNTNTWNADNEFVRATYDRIFYEIALCNEFIRQTSDDNLSKRGISATDAPTIRTYRAEARFLRALSYWHAIDLFGGGPFATEANAIGTVPQYKKGSDMFAYVESELKDLDATNALIASHTIYARADQATCWTLLTKLYLNAKVYTGTDRSTDAITYATKVLGAGYTLTPNYSWLFLADNDKTSASNEIIFPITFDGLKTQNYGGMTYLTHAPTGGAIAPASIGIGGGWAGLRTKANLVNLFPGGAVGTDARQSLFFTTKQKISIDTIGPFNNGYAVTKYKNLTSKGASGSDTSGNFPDTDFPMFRLADVQLMYAEAVLRGGTGGTTTQALAYVNAIRTRSGAAPLASITLNDILDERGRELFWEGHRRTDLIRFGKYTTGYNWPFKGGVQAGKDIEATRTLFPIPNTDRVANTNLPQNPGY
ncbi:MAG: RagB/SusD family nutrient uptake outer membrane protein [Janthinobacterium lividum]